ncbi:MAG: potassium channel protein [Flavobacteriales bacterium]
MIILPSFKYFKELYYAVIFLFGMILLGTVGYVFIEGYAWLDGFYMTAITLSTVGFEEVQPLSPAGKVFTAFLIITTFGTFAYTVTNITRYLVSGQYRTYYKNYKVMNELEHLVDHVIVCGYGRNGRQAVKTLEAHNKTFAVIEGDQEVVNRVHEEHPEMLIIHGDATDESMLQKAGVERANALIATLPKDADNLFVVLSSRELNKGLNIISRASDDRSERKLKIAGANNVILPDSVGGSHMATLVLTPDLMEFLDHISLMGKDESTLVEVRFRNLPKDFEHKTIMELEKRYQTGARIIGFKTPENQIIVNPSPETELVPKSKLFVLGNPSQIKALKEALSIDD